MNFIEIKTMEHFHSTEKEAYQVNYTTKAKIPYNESGKNDILHNSRPYNKGSHIFISLCKNGRLQMKKRKEKIFYQFTSILEKSQ